MYLGGASLGGPCTITHDFWCSTNWRLEPDAYGCSEWKYDVRKPAPGENAYCQLEKCTPGNYIFCRCTDGSEGTKLCKADGTPEECSCE